MLLSSFGKLLSFIWPAILGAAFALTLPAGTSYAANSDPPRIHSVTSVLFGGNLYVIGYVSDDSDPKGYIVSFSGDVSGTAVVQEDGRFWFMTAFYQPYGSAVVRTVDRDRKKSDPVSFEFHE